MSDLSLWARFRRPTPAIALVISAALLVAGVVTMMYLERSYEGQKINEGKVQARILSSTVAAALFFDDRKAAQEYVNAVGANPEVRTAAVYDANGMPVVKFFRDEDQSPSHSPPPGARLEDGRVTVVTPVMQDDSSVGTVYLLSVIDPLATRLLRYGVLALLVTMAAVIVALLGMTQKVLHRANVELEDRIHERTAALESANLQMQQDLVERKTLEEQLRQIQKMEAVGRLTGGIAHDFNNLLGIITGNLDLLLDRLKNDPESADFAQDALDGALRGAELTQRMLAFARKQPLQPKAVYLNEILPGMTSMLQRTVREDIAVEMVPSDGLWPALCDKSQVEDAILNLAINARDAMPDGGRLLIETANVTLDEDYAMLEPDVIPGDYVMLAVTDSGTGMPPEVIERVFEPFFTTKPTGMGTGLGLSMVYGLAKQSGGHIKIYSEVGHGTTVRLYLPKVVIEDGSIQVEQNKETAYATDHETILVVEDDIKLRRIVVRLLDDLGYVVRESHTPQHALEILAGDEDIDLLFTDIVMPGGITGFDLADAAKKLRPKLKTLLTTGYSEVFVKNSNASRASVELMSKPYRKQELAEKIHAIFNGTT